MWFQLNLVLLFLYLISSFDIFLLRLIFFVNIGFSIVILFENSTNFQKELFIFPSFIVLFVNLLISIFQISFLDNTYGWINYFYENASYFESGRLSGLQGSGPNVAGALFAFLLFIYFSFYLKFGRKIYLFASLISLFLVFISYSRGSYLAIFVCFLIYFTLKDFSIKKLMAFSFLILFSSSFFLYFGNAQIILKESDRSYLTNIALDNIKLFSGFGGGNYVQEIYKNYLLSIDPEILESSLNIKLNKVALGITPEDFRDSNVDFYIGTSGSGYEILQNSFVVNECEYDRRTCQYQRVDTDILSKFTSVILEQNQQESEALISTSNCIDDTQFISRIEFGCFMKSINSKFFNKDYKNYEFVDIEDQNDKDIMSFLIYNNLLPECEITSRYSCLNREMAVGEIAVIIENLTIDKNILPIENFQIYCDECSYLSVDGFIKFEYDKIQGILPRSTFKFYTSTNGIDWDLVGSQRTTGNILEFNSNSGYIEIGGYSDGQSPGNTFLDATVKNLIIKDINQETEISFSEENLGDKYHIFKPYTYENYDAKITFENGGLKLFRPNKYWLAIENKFDFQNDFEITIQLSFPEVPWERQTLISNTSSQKNEHQSWKIDIDDGRFFFYWIDEEGSLKKNYVVGDKSLRSGILSQTNGLLVNKAAPIVDPSNLSQLTTAHNGYLTFAVEFGLIWSVVFYTVIIFIIFNFFNKLKNKNSFEITLFLSLIIFLITNLTNDMIYSPDIFLIFVYSLVLNYSFIKDSDFKKS